jgi:hypothetical protein
MRPAAQRSARNRHFVHVRKLNAATLQHNTSNKLQRAVDANENGARTQRKPQARICNLHHFAA